MQDRAAGVGAGKVTKFNTSNKSSHKARPRRQGRRGKI